MASFFELWSEIRSLKNWDILFDTFFSHIDLSCFLLFSLFSWFKMGYISNLLFFLSQNFIFFYLTLLRSFLSNSSRLCYLLCYWLIKIYFLFFRLLLCFLLSSRLLLIFLLFLFLNYWFKYLFCLISYNFLLIFWLIFLG